MGVPCGRRHARRKGQMSAPIRKAELAVSAFNEGCEAFLQGMDESVNPYQPGTMLAEDWLRGWDAECARFIERQAA